MEPDGALEPHSLVELSVRRLRHEILSGAFAPGERLIEEQLTQRFGTSRAPLREALRSLGQQGLVEHLPRRGVRVAELTPTDVDELFGLRDVLERYAMQTALPLRDGQSLEGLAEALDGMAAAVEADDPFSENEAHRRFHVALVELAGHRQLQLVYEPVILKLQLYMAANLRREAEQRAPSTGVARHRRLFDAVSSGDAAIAIDALTRHGARTYIG
ncbi:GntR family transcriptional regulator [Sphaerisporangium sp. TRM90804]|uniref:GntR family transcriptional regulator n=1 Tax=Sphaerisporangium sp. TRM90804 TaxID=3031113 RepID=UPI002446AE9C|nr:GntR family transcriptional regulator [Sphaerisporangium sp. TRM90804]MDH2429084.1 GntR family transcriptional regulator [Sphaerisporangium sp. TRM90804]